MIWNTPNGEEPFLKLHDPYTLVEKAYESGLGWRVDATLEVLSKPTQQCLAMCYS